MDPKGGRYAMGRRGSNYDMDPRRSEEVFSMRPG
jgi:hypothetical protein